MSKKIYPLLFLCVLAFILISALGVIAAQPGGQEGHYDAKEDYRFRPDHELQGLQGKSAYQKFQEREGIPVHGGFAVNLYEVKLAPWKRMGTGVTGAYLNLDGAGGMVDAFRLDIEPGGQTNPVHHLFEEHLLILEGEGETHIWQSDPKNKVVIPWKKGTLFAPPLNAWHQHFNKGDTPARQVAVTDLPLKIDLFRNPDFIFNSSYNFTDRYTGEDDYFDPEISRDFGPTKEHHSLSIVNLVRNVWSWRLFHAGQGYDDVDRHFLLSDNTMGGHVEQFSVGTYERAHRHGPAATIVLLNGTGHSLMWPASIGTTPWQDGNGDQVRRVDWGPGTMVVPPLDWFHQHYNTGNQPARFTRLGDTPGNELYPMTSQDVLKGGKKYTILFRMEDAYVRDHFDRELAEHGAKIQMPSREDLIESERKSGYEPVTVP